MGGVGKGSSHSTDLITLDIRKSHLLRQKFCHRALATASRACDKPDVVKFVAVYEFGSPVGFNVSIAVDQAIIPFEQLGRGG